MRICIDLTSLADNFSGIERYAACISMGLIQNYTDYFMLVFKNNVHSLFSEVVKKNNIETIIIPGRNKLYFNQVKLPHTLRLIQADWFLFLAFPVPLFLFRKNMVETIHDIIAWDCPQTMNGMSKWYFRISHLIAIKKCKAVITISDFSSRRIQDRLHYPVEKIWKVYCGIDRERFVVCNEKNESIITKYRLPQEYILSLSTLEPRKNLPMLIDAYIELLNENKKLPPLVLAGRKGWGFNELLSKVSDEVKSQIIFTGFIDDCDLPIIYGMAKLFVFPSSYEGFGIPPLEALACGTPVLVSDAEALTEVCGNAAIYFMNNNIDDLKEKLLYAISTCCNYDIEMGIKQVAHFVWEQEASKLHKYLESNSR